MIAELRRIRRREIARLRALGVEVSELSGKRSREALERFARDFVAPDGVGEFLAATEAARLALREVDHARWMRQDGRAPEKNPRLSWLAGGRTGVRCVRLDRRVALPALVLSLDDMREEWAFSWPAAYVAFESRRALVVSLDYEVTSCDLATLGASPYR